MADNAYEPSVPAIPQDGQLDPQLRDAAGAFQTPEGKNWAGGIVQETQQAVNLARVSDANDAAGQHLINSYNTVKQNMLGMVSDNPANGPLAVNLSRQLLEPLFGHMAPDEGAAAHDEVATALQTEVAHAAVTGMADKNAAAAHILMEQLAPHIGGDENTAVLRNYIDTMQVARTADNATTSEQMASQQQRASGIAAYQYAGGLLDPRTEEVQFPPNYLANLVKDPKINPEDKEALFLAHGNLRQSGDVPTDPFTMAGMVNRLNAGEDISHKEIMQHVGGDLRFADAQMLHGLANTRTPEFDGHISDLANVLNDARDKLTNGTRAGDAAYSRFVDWFLPSYRRAGTDSFNPKAEGYLFANTSLANFAPRSSDLVPSNPGPRTSLSQIFSGNNVPSNESLRPAAVPMTENSEIPGPTVKPNRPFRR